MRNVAIFLQEPFSPSLLGCLPSSWKILITLEIPAELVGAPKNSH